MTLDNTALAFAGDDSVAPALAVAIHSALLRLSPSVNPLVLVLDTGLSASSRTRLETIVATQGRSSQLRWTEIPPARLANRSGTRDGSPATYARLLLPDILPAEITRAVYLDADVLVQRDLSPLFVTDLGGTAVAAVRDFAIPETGHEWSTLRDVGPSTPYLNSGVLVLDLPRWRERDLGESVFRYAVGASTRNALRFRDQDALNAVVGPWRELDFRWNVQIGLLFLADQPAHTAFLEHLYERRWRLRSRAYILHFAGAQKPWYYWYVPGAGSWVRALWRTRWYSWPQYSIWMLRWVMRTARYLIGSTKHLARLQVSRHRAPQR